MRGLASECPQALRQLLQVRLCPYPRCLLPIPRAQHSHLVQHVFKLELQVAKQAVRQGQAGQGQGQAARQVCAHRTTAQMLQGSRLPHQGEERGVEVLVFLGAEGGFSKDR